MAKQIAALNKSIPKRVLIADSDNLIQSLLQGYLEKIGCESVECCPSAIDALERLKDDPNYDLIIFDWKQKDVVGPEFLGHLRKTQRTMRIPVIAVSGFLTAKDINHVKTHPHLSFMVKPITEEVFITVVGKYYEGVNPKKASKKKPTRNVTNQKAVLDEVDATLKESSVKNIGEESDLFHVKGDGNQGPGFSEDDIISGSGNQGRDIGVLKSEPQQSGLGIHVEKNDEQNHGHGTFVDKRGGQGSGHGTFVDKKDGQLGGHGTFIDKKDQRDQGHGTFVDKKDGVYDPSRGIYIAKKEELPTGKDIKVEGKRPEDGGGVFEDSQGIFDFNATQNDPLKNNPFDFKEDDQERLAKFFDDTFSAADPKNASDLDPDAAAPMNQGVVSMYSQFASESGALFFSDDAANVGELGSQKLGIQSILLVEKDEALRKIVSKYVMDLGISDLVPVGSGDEAWALLQQRKFDLVMMDWKISGLSGIALYNRIRKNKEFANLPVIVTAGFPGRQDFRILQEHRCTAFIEKPFQVTEIDRVLLQLFHRVREDKAANAEVTSLLRSIREGNETLLAVLEQILTTIKPPLSGLLAASQFLFERQAYEEAEQTLLVALKIDSKNMMALTWLGKVLHRLNRPREAMKHLEKAETMSSNNIARLCLLGEVGLTLRDPDKAREYFKQALVIDKKDATAQAGIVLSDNLDDFINNYTTHPIPLERQFGSMLNIVGITFVRNKEFEKGFEQYLAAMAFIDDATTLSKLEFNLGLAYLRARKFAKAREWLAKAIKNAPPEYMKPQDFLSRVDAYERSKDKEKLIIEDRVFQFINIDDDEDEDIILEPLPESKKTG